MGKVHYTPEQVAANKANAAPYKERRLALGLSQKQLAQKAGIDESGYRRMELGQSVPIWETRQKIRRVLGMPEERVFTTEERNAIFLEIQSEIQWIIRKNLRTIKAVHIDPEDVFQELALEAIRAIDRYTPGGKATVKTFVEKNITRYIAKIIVRGYLHDMTGKITYPLPAVSVISFEALVEAGAQFAG